MEGPCDSHISAFPFTGEDCASRNRELEESTLPLLRHQVATLQQRLQARKDENLETSRRLALAEEQIANRDSSLGADELEVEVR